MCSRTDGLRRVACCETLWSQKTRDAGRKTDEDKDTEEEEEENKETSEEKGKGEKEKRCIDQKQEATMKYRQQQYRDNPSMRITPEDVEEVMECEICGPDITECALEECEECGKSWVREDYTLCRVQISTASWHPGW